MLIALNIDQVGQHLLGGILSQNTAKRTPVYDEEQTIGAAGQMRVWCTTTPNAPTTRSHVSHVVGDSAWEQYAANIFERHTSVAAYVKNDHWGIPDPLHVGRPPPTLSARLSCSVHFREDAGFGDQARG